LIGLLSRRRTINGFTTTKNFAAFFPQLIFCARPPLQFQDVSSQETRTSAQIILRLLRHARGEQINVISIPNPKAAQENSWLCQHPRPIRRQK
jgi:hypothetical protein